MASGASVTAAKKPAISTDAPIWKNYLAVRSEAGANGSGSSTTAHARSRKRAKPSSGLLSSNRSSAVSASTSQLLPPHNAHANEQLQSDIALRVRAYWEQLSAPERQQVLFIDEPELVKQLYKLNLSLLCVGLMQRHLKTPLQKAATAAAAASTTIKQDTGTSPAASSIITQQQQQRSQTAAPAASPSNSSKSSNTLEPKASAATAATTSTADVHGEKTYELLEAMEFMDIGTGILTVKSELVEVPERLFTLVGDVLVGFASSLHVLSDAQFLSLFVTESEVITSWEDYERLIAMLVEQLMLKSYVSYLEREATRQMEQLLLEVSLEDARERGSGGSSGNSNNNNTVATAALGKRKTKKKQKAKTKAKTKTKTAASKMLDMSAVAAAATATVVTVAAVDVPSGDGSDQPEPEDFDIREYNDSSSDLQYHQQHEPILDSTDSEGSRSACDSIEPESVDELLENQQTVLAIAIDSDGDDAHVDDCTTTTTLAETLHKQQLESAVSDSELVPTDRIVAPRAPASSLNPNASVFEPQHEPLARGPIIGKRKLDKFIVSVDALDIASDHDSLALDSDDDGNDDISCTSYDDDDDDDDNDCYADVRRRRKVARWHRNEADAKLTWQLEQIYASTSLMLGYDLARQCDVEVAPPSAPMLWDAADALWRTAPRDVVRYFTPGGVASLPFGAFFSPSTPLPMPPPPPSSSSHVHTYAFTATAASTGIDLTAARYYFTPPPPAAPSPAAAAFLPPPSGASSSSSSNNNTSAEPETSPLVIKSYYHSR